MPEPLMIRSKIHNYSVEFVDHFNEQIKNLAGNNCFFVVDAKVYDLYRNGLELVIPGDRMFVIKATEQAKTLDNSSVLINSLIGRGIRKNDQLVAIGGGIVQDLTAFVASILFRGIKWIFFPSTLLAQADSCIGGKTSINFGNYKNLIGNFYPPEKIMVNIRFLETLREEDIKSGIGEMLHFYLIASSRYADDIADEYEHLMKDRSRLLKYIVESLGIKKKVIERDEFDKGERNLFNYGHTFGHALESVSDYSINHGQAVTLGMGIANVISLETGLLDKLSFDRMQRVLEKNMPVFELSHEHMDRYFDALGKDKKNVDRHLTCILTEGPGRMKKTKIPLDENLRQFIASYFNHRAVSVS